MMLSRRGLLSAAAATLSFAGGLRLAGTAKPAGAVSTAFATTGAGQATGPMMRRTIPSSGESIPVIGLGTAGRFSGPNQKEATAALRAAIEKFAALGGVQIDTSSAYGEAEAIVGTVIAKHEARDRLFLSTQVSVTGRANGLAQIENSFKRLRPARIDLISVRNLRDAATQLSTLRDLKEAQLVRYIGVTTSSESQDNELESLLARKPLDVVQIDYSLDKRSAAERVLRLAAEREIAVMINRPFGAGRLFDSTRHRELPQWAAEFECRSWPQFFLKYVLSHDAVTCALPEMASEEDVVHNFSAAFGRLPDAAIRRRMEDFIGAL